ncbi:MAG: hypothetical protein J0I10_08255 [Verrucomicrobia bacterium]|nr:hypothetical protein [Verrucomicrobiota bacterium]
MKQTLRAALIVIGLIGPMSLAARAAVIANFTEGNGSTLPDQYVGAAGAGWTTAWTNTNATVLTGNVTNTSPLSGGGNYLSLALTQGAGSVTYINRTWSNTEVPYTGGVTLSWSFRLDSPITSFNAQADVLHFYDGLGGAASFLISGFGATTGTASGQTWAFYNGNRDGAAWNGNNYVNTGISITTGTMYTFSVTLDPSTRSWTGTVSNGTSSYTSSALGFRTSAYSANGTFILGMQESVSSKNLTASFDSLSIVPENQTSALAAFGFGLMLFLAKARRFGSRSKSRD